MYCMDKLIIGVVYGVLVGSILNGMLNVYSFEQWNVIGVLVGIIIVVMMYLINFYFKICEDNCCSRS